MNKAPLLDTPDGKSADRSIWHISWPLVVGALVYLFSMLLGRRLLADGDTYWHIATGQWILDNRSIPTTDPFSHTMPGAAPLHTTLAPGPLSLPSPPWLSR
jgi:hypothetical protein